VFHVEWWDIPDTNDELLIYSLAQMKKIRKYGRGDPLRWPRDTLYPQKLALTSRTSGGRSVGIVHLQTKATEFVLFFLIYAGT
jgi:hypothetical protein